MNPTLQKINGYGAMGLRGAIVILIPVFIWVASQLGQDIRAKFDEITKDLGAIRSEITAVRKEMVPKDAYYLEIARQDSRLTRIEARLDKRGA